MPLNSRLAYQARSGLVARRDGQVGGAHLPDLGRVDPVIGLQRGVVAIVRLTIKQGRGSKKGKNQRFERTGKGNDPDRTRGEAMTHCDRDSEWALRSSSLNPVPIWASALKVGD